MNWAVLKDWKTNIGFVLGILLNIVAIILAASNIGYWILFLFSGQLVTVVSTFRADRLTRGSS
ncbi:hypothetical protein [Pontibacillus salipaludis]|uniref:Uncharacterized protein n=1 Tax=Pontibacillus salipaludis TaxID=1697394 RepID=A0ABQ1QCV4_9BACI|nr:hypothetical protein [Pontibacillus salipaludis]GGD21439.1 hypothetical protein GCM10011389_31420 [Pontibacillus salipaludis]